MIHSRLKKIEKVIKNKHKPVVIVWHCRKDGPYQYNGKEYKTIEDLTAENNVLDNTEIQFYKWHN